MPDGAGIRAASRGSSLFRERSRRRNTTLAAASTAAALHLAVVAPLLWLLPRPQPPETVAAVEITPVPAAAMTPAGLEQSVTNMAAPEPTQPPETAAPVPAAEPAAPVQPEPVTTPEPAQALTSAEPPIADAAADLLHAEQPQPEAVATAPPVPQVAPLPLPPPVPQRRPVPPRPVVARPTRGPIPPRRRPRQRLHNRRRRHRPPPRLRRCP